MARTRPDLRALRGVPPFVGCSDRELAAVRRLSTEVALPAGTAVVREDERGVELFVLLDGTAAVSRGRTPLGVLGPGQIFGELALLGPSDVRDATVTALSPVRLLVVGRRELWGLLVAAPALARALLAGMARRLQDADGADRVAA